MCELFGLLPVLAFFAMLIGIGVAIGKASNKGHLALRCPGCHRQWPEPFDRCGACGWVRGAANRRDDLAEWAIVARRLRILQAEAAIPEEIGRQVLDAVERQIEIQQAAAPPTPLYFPINRSPAAETRRRLIPEQVPDAEPQDVVEFLDEEAPPQPVTSTPHTATHATSLVAALKAETTPPEPPRQPRRQLSDVLRAFMEERNIRWGEILSGLLIVGSAIGLIVSLWATLKQAIPYFPALVFLGVTAGIHGAGVYTLHRWRLKSTSRALLIIATLLVPLNYLAAIALSDMRPVTDPLYLTALGISLIVFGAQTLSAASILVPRRAFALWLAVMGPSLAQLMIARLARPGLPTESVLGMMLVPAASFAVALAWTTNGFRRLAVPRVGQLVLLSGIATFCLLAPTGLLLFKSESLRWTGGQLGPVLVLVGTLWISLGQLVRRRFAGKRLPTVQTAATSTMLFGSVMLLAALGLAWPNPQLVLLTSGAGCVALFALALSGRVPVLQAPAIWLGTFAGLVVIHRALGADWGLPPGARFPDLLQTGTSSLFITGCGVLTGGLALVWRRRRWHDLAATYAVSMLVLAVISLLLGVDVGFTHTAGFDRNLTTLVFAGWSLMGLIAVPPLVREKNLREQEAGIVGWVLSGLALTATAHGLLFNTWVAGQLRAAGLFPVYPLVATIFTHGLLISGCAALFRYRRGINPHADTPNETQSALVAGLCWSVWVTSALGLMLLKAAATHPLPSLTPFGMPAAYVWWAGAIWALCAVAIRRQAGRVGAASELSFVAFQGLSTVAVVLSVSWLCERYEWVNWTHFTQGWWSVRHLHAQAVGLSAWALLWMAVIRWGNAPVVWLGSATRRVPQVLLTVVVASGVWLAGMALCPSVATEFAFSPGPARVDMALYGVMLPTLVMGILASLALAASRAQWGMVFVAGCLLTVVVAQSFWEPAVLEWWRQGIDEPQAAFGPEAWLTWSMPLVAVVLLVASARKNPSKWSVGLLATVAFWGLLLTVGEVAPWLGVASTLRWSAALTALLIAGLRSIGAFAWVTPISLEPTEPTRIPRGDALNQGVSLVCIGALLFVAGLTARFFAGVLQGGTLPTLTGLTLWVGPVLSYAVPLGVLAVACGLTAFRRSPLNALAAALLTNLTVSVVYLLRHWAGPTRFTVDNMAELVQWNALALSAVAWIWLAGRRSIEGGSIERGGPVPVSPLSVHMVRTGLAGPLLALWTVVFVLLSPNRPTAVLGILGNGLSYACVALSLGAWGWYLRLLREPASDLTADPAVTLERRFAARSTGTHVAALAWLSLAGITAATSSAWSQFSAWVGLYVLLSGWIFFVATAVAISWILTWRQQTLVNTLPADRIPGKWLGELDLTLADLERQNEFLNSVVRWALMVGSGVAFLGLYALPLDPWRPWTTVAAWGLMACASAALALRSRNQTYAWLATLMTLAATVAFSLRPWLGLGVAQHDSDLVVFLETNLIGLVAAAIGWLGVELWWQTRRASPFDVRPALTVVHRTLAMFTLTASLFLIILQVCSIHPYARLFFPSPWLHPAPGILVLLLTALHAGMLWDRKSHAAFSGLYVCGLMGIGLALSGRDWNEAALMTTGSATLAGYTLAVSLLWLSRRAVVRTLWTLSVPRAMARSLHVVTWLPGSQMVVSVGVLIAACFISLTDSDQRHSWTVAAAAVGLVPALALLVPPRRMRLVPSTELADMTCVAFTAAVILLGWAPLQVPVQRQGMDFVIRALLMLGAAATAMGLLSFLCRQKSFWKRRLQTAAMAVWSLSGSVFVFLDVMYFQELRRPPISLVDMVLVCGGLAVSAGLLIRIALRMQPVLDDTAPSRAKGCVFGAEALVALAFLHAWVVRPDLFQLWRPWWPFIVMAIAFAGVAVGELFRRRHWRVLADPVQQTAAFLPLLPALGFWLGAPRGSHSTILFLAGIAYVLLATSRGGLLYQVAAALAGNAALWALWHEQGITLFTHPQVWLIPPALVVLIAGQIHRRQLSDAQLGALRYAMILQIYVSSAGEMFLTGVGQNLWMPMVLATLSVAGALCGIMLRIRAFLYLGASFLLLAIVSMVSHAAQHINHVWPWWAFGLALGLAILTLFGLFEKRRQEMLDLVGQMKTWE